MMPSSTPLPLTASRADKIFPTLTTEQIHPIARYGQARSVRTGDVLTIALDGGVRVLKVVGFRDRRGSSDAALALYEDIGRGERLRSRSI